MAIYLARLMTLLTLVLSIGNAYAVDKNIEANVGGTRIAIPEPKNYSDPSPMIPGVRKFGENMTASTNRLLGFFMSDDDVKALLAQTAPQLHRYFMVQTLRATEDTLMTAQEFSVVREQVKNQYKKLFDDHAALMQSEINRAVDRITKDGKTNQAADLNLKLGEMKVLEGLSDDRYVSLVAKTLVQATVNGEVKQIPMALGMTSTMVKGKVIYFFSYARFNSDEDIHWIKAQVTAWIPLLFAANKSE